MKMTMTDGTVFEGSMAEYTELLAFAKAQQAEELKVGSPETDVVATEDEVMEPPFEVGDFIVGLGGKYEITNEGMTLGKVVSGYVRGRDDVRVEVLTHSTRKDRIGRTYSVQSKYFRKATTEEIAQYEKAVADASKPKLKAGDFVKFTKSGDYDSTDITLNNLYEIEHNGIELGFYDDDVYFRTAPIKDGVGCYEIVDAETAKWAKIGRKPGEYKKGDIVRVIEDACTKPVGAIFGVEHASSTAVSCDEGYAYGIGRHIELITPVDARFDK